MQARRGEGEGGGGYSRDIVGAQYTERPMKENNTKFIAAVKSYKFTRLLLVS